MVAQGYVSKSVSDKRADDIHMTLQNGVVKEAVAAVGDLAADVEMHLKGSRSTTNSERVADQS